MEPWWAGLANRVSQFFLLFEEMSSSGLAEADAEELAVLDAPDMASAAPPGSQTAPTQQHPNKRVRRTKAAADEPEEEDSDGDESAPGVKAKRSAADKKAFAASASAQISAIRREQAKAQKARLRFLLGQSEIFRHFIENLDGPLANPTDNVAPAASFSSPHLGAEAGVSEEIGEALLLSPMRAAAAAHHKDGTGAAMTDAPPSPKASGVVVPLSPPPSVRRTRSDASAAVAPAAASGATAGAVEGKTRKRARSAKGVYGNGGVMRSGRHQPALPVSCSGSRKRRPRRRRRGRRRGRGRRRIPRAPRDASAAPAELGEGHHARLPARG